MAHIHTQPNQHDMTVSGYIIREIDGGWRCMVHFHKKIDVYMQVGGHIELDETPWQAMAHELEEESGYTLAELHLLQPTKNAVQTKGNITHPVPFSSNTHNVGNEHYHSDLCYGFVASDEPRRPTAENESDDIRWMTVQELKQGAESGKVLQDVAGIYEYLLEILPQYHKVQAVDFSLEKPTNNGIQYNASCK
jgi:8-oxo-dGTP pyrophosphatase MutT (NUDIX family)